MSVKILTELQKMDVAVSDAGKLLSHFCTIFSSHHVFVSVYFSLYFQNARGRKLGERVGGSGALIKGRIFKESFK